MWYIDRGGGDSFLYKLRPVLYNRVRKGVRGPKCSGTEYMDRIQRKLFSICYFFEEAEKSLC